MVKFGDVVRQVSEAVRDPAKEGLDRIVGLEHIDSDDLHIKRWDDIGEGTSFSKRFRRGQVLFGRRRAYLRKVAYAEFDGICSGDITVMESKGNELLPELLPFLVQTDGFYEHTQKVSAGGLSPRAKWRDLAGYEFALPPIPEQRRIAEILWAAERAEVQWAGCAKQLANLTDAWLGEYSRTADAAVRGANPQLTVVGENLSWDVRQWRHCTLGDIARIRRGASPRPIGDPRWFSSDGPGWVRIADVTASDGVLTKTTQYLSAEGVSRTVRVFPGQVIMSICATIGEPIIVGMEACIHDGFVVFDELSLIGPEFLVWLLRSRGSYFKKHGQPGTQVNLNADIVKECAILVPPPQVQERIVAFLSDIAATRRKVEDACRSIAALRSKYLQAELSSGRRGAPDRAAGAS